MAGWRTGEWVGSGWLERWGTLGAEGSDWGTGAQTWLRLFQGSAAFLPLVKEHVSPHPHPNFWQLSKRGRWESLCVRDAVTAPSYSPGSFQRLRGGRGDGEDEAQGGICLLVPHPGSWGSPIPRDPTNPTLFPMVLLAPWLP